MTAWRGVCRVCGDKPVRGRAWCRRCLLRIRVTGVADFHEYPTWEESRKSGAGDRVIAIPGGLTKSRAHRR